MRLENCTKNHPVRTLNQKSDTYRCSLRCHGHSMSGMAHLRAGVGEVFLCCCRAAIYGQGCAAVPITMRVPHSYLRTSGSSPTVPIILAIISRYICWQQLVPQGVSANRHMLGIPVCTKRSGRERGQVIMLYAHGYGRYGGAFLAIACSRN